jgi:hypothetical protein
VWGGGEQELLKLEWALNDDGNGRNFGPVIRKTRGNA